MALVTKHDRIVRTGQIVCQLCVRHLACGGYHPVHESTFDVRPDVGLPAVMPLIALPCRAHVTGASARLVPGRRRWRNQRGVQDRAAAQQKSALFRTGLDRVRQRLGQTMSFQRMAKVENGGLVRNGLAARLQPGKFAHRMRVVERLFGARIGQAAPPLQESAAGLAPLTACTKSRIVKARGKASRMAGAQSDAIRPSPLAQAAARVEPIGRALPDATASRNPGVVTVLSAPGCEPVSSHGPGQGPCSGRIDASD